MEENVRFEINKVYAEKAKTCVLIRSTATFLRLCASVYNFKLFYIDFLEMPAFTWHKKLIDHFVHCWSQLLILATQDTSVGLGRQEIATPVTAASYTVRGNLLAFWYRKKSRGNLRS